MNNSFFQHIASLRRLIIHLFLWLGIVFVICWWKIHFIEKIFLFAAEKNNILPLLVLSPLEKIIVQLQIAFFMAIIILFPYILYKFYLFFESALYPEEKKTVNYIFIAYAIGIGAFFIGIYIVSPFLLRIFISANIGKEIVIRYSYKKYINFIFSVGFLCIFMGELPLVIFVFKDKLNIEKNFKRYRSYIYLGIFILSAFLTPPDVLSQIFVSLFLIILCELTYFVLKLKRKR